MCFETPSSRNEPDSELDDAHLIAEAIAIDLLRLFGQSGVVSWAQIDNYLTSLAEQTRSTARSGAGDPLPHGRGAASNRASQSAPETRNTAAPMTDGRGRPRSGPHKDGLGEGVSAREACGAKRPSDNLWPLRC